jgi:hypothetical protein
MRTATHINTYQHTLQHANAGDEVDARATGAVAGRSRAAAIYYAAQQHALQCALQRTLTHTNTHCNTQTQEMKLMREQLEQLQSEREQLLKAATANNEGKLSGGSKEECTGLFEWHI